jgi:hypothetical protein
MEHQQLNQVEEFIRRCCQHRPEGGKFVLLGMDAALVNGIENLNSRWDVEYHDQYFASNLWATYDNYSLDLVYIHSVDASRNLVDAVYDWGPKIRGGGAMAGWGYQDTRVRKQLLDRIGDCPSKWPDIWALPIVGFGSAAETQQK